MSGDDLEKDLRLAKQVEHGAHWCDLVIADLQRGERVTALGDLALALYHLRSAHEELERLVDHAE